MQDLGVALLARAIAPDLPGFGASGKPLDAAKKYKVAGWAPVSEEARTAGGEPIWDVIARYLRAQKAIAPRAPNLPQVEGAAGQFALRQPMQLPDGAHPGANVHGRCNVHGIFHCV